MSIVYSIDREKGLTLVRWIGVVTADDFLAHVRRLSSDKDWPPPRRLHFADLRLAPPDASMDETALKRAADLYGMHQEKVGGMKAAIVAGEAFWKAVEFESIISRYGARVMTFNSLNTACT